MGLGKCCVLILLAGVVVQAERQSRLLSGDDLISSVTEDCVVGDTSVTTCIRQKVLSYMNNVLGISCLGRLYLLAMTEICVTWLPQGTWKSCNNFLNGYIPTANRNEHCQKSGQWEYQYRFQEYGGVSDQSTGRQLSDDVLDDQVAARMSKFLNTHDFKVQLPEFIFQNAILTFRPSRGLADFKVDFPEPTNEARADSEARGMLKKKLLLPLLLLVKLKMKALTPILLLLVGLKAFKALILSKLSFLVVVGFLIVQLCKKLGMAMPMPMPAAMATEIPPVYGPAPTPAPYGVPAQTPDNSYGPWDSSSGNGGSSGSQYARWDAHNIAYSSYQPETVKTSSVKAS